MIEIKELINLLIIMIGIKLTLEHWKPPIKKSYQAIICTLSGCLIACFFDPTKAGLMNGLVCGTLSYWGVSIFLELKELTSANKEYVTVIKEESKPDKK